MTHLSIFILFFSFQILTAQTVIEDAWVFSIDKPQQNTYFSNPLNILSQRALDRRNRLNIPLDEKDVPVDSNYYNQIAQANGITIMGKSKWLNALHVQGTQSDIEALLNLNFVSKIEFANKNIGVVTAPRPFEEVVSPIESRRVNYDYGQGANQINMLHGEIMHQNNFTGNGVLVAVIDAGFIGVDTGSIFQDLFQNNKILDVYNFPDHNTSVYGRHTHGCSVLSTIAAKSNGILVGTAPDVSIALYISEDVNQEMPIEETYWAEAAERADSLGVDVINTSLGYQTYDRPEYSYTMADLDGQTSFISRAATIAVSRGINVIVSAGNSGDTDWPKIGMPADAAPVITVGAVDANRVRASFSSIGPTADGRIKPDVMAQGQGTAVFSNGQVQLSNGTSFSSPITAGMVACMVQAFPTKTPAQIKQDLIRISDQYNNPDNYYGYGIPDFSQYNTNGISTLENQMLTIYPNPAVHYIYVKNLSTKRYQIYNMQGQILMNGQTDEKIDISSLKSGVYFFKSNNHIQKFLVQ